MKQYQFEYSNGLQLRTRMEQISRHLKNAVHGQAVFQILTTEMAYESIKPVTDLIEKLMPNALYYGCQSFGNIRNGEYSKAKTLVTCTVFESDTTQAELRFIEEKDDPAVWKAAEAEINALPWVKAVEVLSTVRGADRMALGEDKIALRPDIAVYGGIAAMPEDTNSDLGWVFAKGHAESNEAVVVLITGGEQLSVMTDYVVGWKGLGRRFHVTDASGNVMKKLNDEPAFELYKRYLKIERTDKMLERVVSFPLLVEKNGLDCLRVPVEVNEEGEISMTIAVEKHASVRIAYGDSNTILEEVNEKLKQFASFHPETIKVFSCLARKTFWGDEHVSEETRCLDALAPSSGFFTRGEFLRIGDYLYHLNCTMVLVGFREGDVQETVSEDEISELIPPVKPQDTFLVRLLNLIEATSEEQSSIYLSTMKALASIYWTLHLVDLKADSITEYKAPDRIHDYTLEKPKAHAYEVMQHVISKSMTPAYQERALEFTDLRTVQKRLMGKKFISEELIGNVAGWIRAQFVPLSFDENGVPEAVLFTTTVIEDEKRREQQLRNESRTDELTGLENRRALDELFLEYEGKPVDDELVYLTLDANGLKEINDIYGHAAGDEMLVGIAQCLQKVFGGFGRVFRIGGDEYTVIIRVAPSYFEQLLETLRNTLDTWTGIRIHSLSAAVGYTRWKNHPKRSLRSLSVLADDKMYADKEQYYLEKGDRRHKRGIDVQ